MDTGEIIYTVSRLVIGAVAAFFAIIAWSKIRDLAWIFMVMGTIAIYVETVYSILNLFGIIVQGPSIDSVPLALILLHNLPTAFFLAAFVVAAGRKYRKF